MPAGSPAPPDASARNVFAHWHSHLVAALALLALVLVLLPVQYPKYIDDNLNVAEGFAWWEGRLDLDRIIHDYAHFRGKRYNVYPPLVSILAALACPLCPRGIPGWTACPLLIVPIFALAYGVFFRMTRRPYPAAALTALYVFGTPLYPILLRAASFGAVYHVNHAISQIGILIILFEYFGRRRMGVMVAGLLICAWTRQFMAAYALAILWVAWTRTGPDRRRSLLIVATTLLVLAAVPMTLSALKFGSPFEPGYRYIHADVADHPAGPHEWHGVFSIRYVPANFYYMNLRPPAIRLDSRGRPVLRDDYIGTALWFTTPVLLFFWVDIRRHWRDPACRMLILSMVPIVAGLLLYYNTGADQRGYHRFTLDFLVPILVMSAPHLLTPLRRWVTIPLMAASIVYFRWTVNVIV